MSIWPITEMGRTVFNKKDFMFANIKNPEKQIKKTILFSLMKEEDVSLLQRIHNTSWEATATENIELGLSLEQFKSYYENFGKHIGICAVITDPSGKYPPQTIAGINVMRLHMRMAPGLELIKDDDVPSTWGDCTNGGYSSTTKLYAPGGRIWPSESGDTVICPTVYAPVPLVIEIDGEQYVSRSLMKEILIAVRNVTKYLAINEQRDLQLSAYSSPRERLIWYNRFKIWNLPEQSIEEYLLSSLNDNDAKETAKIFAEGVINEENRMRLLYLLTSWKHAYSDYVNERKDIDPRQISMEEFVRNTNRKPFDRVIGIHETCGANFGKILPFARKDKKAMGFNIIMVYPPVRLEDVQREQAVSPA